VRNETQSDIHLAFLTLACVKVCYRHVPRTQVVLLEFLSLPSSDLRTILCDRRVVRRAEAIAPGKVSHGTVRLSPARAARPGTGI